MLIVPMATKGLSREKGALSPWRTSLREFERATPTNESSRVFLPSAVARSCHQWVGGDSAYTSNLSRSVKVLDFIKSGGPDLTAGSTIFELLVALCTPRICNSTIMIGRCRWGVID